MARRPSHDTRYLESHNGKWRVTVAVPRTLQGLLGTRLKRELHTDSLSIANGLKWQVLADLKDTIRDAANPVKVKRTLVERFALERATERRALSGDALDQFDEHTDIIADGYRGDPIREEVDESGDMVEVRDGEIETIAGNFLTVAKGQATPIALHHPAFMAQNQTKVRTKADDARALKFLLLWCKQAGVSPTLEAITRKQAARFMDGLAAVAGGQGPVTLNKYLNRLSRIWQWLATREHVETDVFARLKLQPPATPHDELERSFTDAEVVKLLAGPATPHMHDLMRIGALTGARLDAVVDLKVRDCAEGLFTFKPQKKEKKPRAVPIHSALLALVAARVAGKSADDDLFPEWPMPLKVGSLRERSFKASNAFTIYRRKAGVDEVVEGKRRALVNFHSFRRWFITKAEQADQPGSIIAVVVGHKREGMTLGRYSAGPLMEQARRCVEAVKLPG